MISEGRPANPVVFAAHDLTILMAIQNNIKFTMLNFIGRDFVKVEPDHFRPYEYEFVALCDADVDYICPMAGGIFVQKCPTSEFLARLRRTY
jgi:hypothetical protein